MNPLILIFASSSRNFPLDTQGFLKAEGLASERLESLSDFITSPLRLESFFCILEVGNPEDVERALIAYEWADAMQPQAPCRFLLLVASKNLNIKDKAGRFGSVEMAHLPLANKNLMFKIDLQLKLLQSEQNKSRTPAEGFTAESGGPARERVLVLRGPRNGTWNSQNAPQGKIRWRWVSSKPPRLEDFEWTVDSPVAPVFDENENAWKVKSPEASLTCMRKEETIYQARQAGGEDNSSLVVSSLGGEPLGPEFKIKTDPPAAGPSEENRNPLLAEGERAAGRGSSLKTFAAQEKIPGQEPGAQIRDPSPGRLTAREKTEVPEGGPSKSRKDEAPSRPDGRERETTSVPGQEIPPSASRPADHPQNRPAPGSAREKAPRTESIARTEIPWGTKEAGPERKAPPSEKSGKTAGAEEPEEPDAILKRQETVSSLRSLLKTESLETCTSAPRETGPDAIPTKQTDYQDVPREEALHTYSSGKNFMPGEEASRPVIHRQAAAPEEDSAPPAGQAAGPEAGEAEEKRGEPQAPAREESPDRKKNPHPERKAAGTETKPGASPEAGPPEPGSPGAVPEQRDSGPAKDPVSSHGTVATSPGRKEEEHRVSGPAGEARIEITMRAERERGKEAESRVGGIAGEENDPDRFLKMRHFVTMTLEELQDKNSSWYPVEGYRIYLSAQHRYYGLKTLEEIFPLWVYEGELAPEFLDLKKAWKFYDRPPVSFASRESLPPLVVHYLNRFLGDRLKATESLPRPDGAPSGLTPAMAADPAENRTAPSPREKPGAVAKTPEPEPVDIKGREGFLRRIVKKVLGDSEE